MPRVKERLLVDTDVIIHYLRNSAAVVRSLDTLREDGKRFACSTITILEVLRGMRKVEQSVTLELLESMKHYAVTDDVVQIAWKLFTERRSKGVTLPFLDSIIAATAVTENLTLLTFNPKDFPQDILYQSV